MSLITAAAAVRAEPDILFNFHRLGTEPHYRKQRALYFCLTKRVIQSAVCRHLRSNYFLVESKRWMATLARPSIFHVVIQKENNPIHFLCDCKHQGVHPSIHNYCSHVLAVMLSICLKQGNSNLLLMRDAELRKEQIDSKILLKRDRIEGAICYMCEKRVTFNKVPLSEELKYECNHCGKIYHKKNFNKLIEFNLSYGDIPTTGNEWMEHVKQKKRIHDLLVREGWAVSYEHAVHCRNPHTGLLNRFPYFLDIFAQRRDVMTGTLKFVGIEIHGQKGHGSKRTISQDHNRNEDIKTQYGIPVIEFYIDSQLKGVDDSLILEEVYKVLGI